MKKIFRKSMTMLLALAMLITGFSFNVLADVSEAPFSGNGTAENPYLISSAADLVMLGELSELYGDDSELGDHYRRAHYKLTADIVMSDEDDFHGICRRAYKTEENGETKYIYNNKKQVFSGTIDGDYHTISNMSLDNYTNFFKEDGSKPNAYEGLISQGSGCTIKNLGLIDVTVSGNATCAAFVAAGGDITIENCFVRGMSKAGGSAKLVAFVGNTGNNNTLTNCYCPANIYEFYSATTPTGVKATNVYLKRALRTWSGYEKVNTLDSIQLATEEAISAFIAASNGAFEEDINSKNGGLPVLAWENMVFSGGKGTEANPYLISTPDDLVALGDFTSISGDAGDAYRDACYKITNDIDMSNVEFHAIARRAEKVIVDGETKYMYNSSGAFTGTIDGDCHIISNLNIDDVTNFYRENGTSFNTYDGFIGYGKDCDIKNLGLVNITLSGNATTTAAFVAGGGDGITIENCFVRGADFGNARAVAFVNGTGNNNTLTNCYCPANVYEFYNAAAPTGVKATNVYLKRALRTWSGYEKVNTLDTIQLATEEAISAFIAASNGAFEEDIYNRNEGYPVLAWENGFYIQLDGNNNVNLKNNLSNSISGVIIIAGYANNEKMLGAVSLKDENESEVFAINLSGKTNVTYTYEPIDGATIYKAFVWNNITDLTPLCLAARYPAE